MPDGFALTTDAFDRFLASNALNTEVSQEKVKAAIIPPDVTKALLTAVEELGDVPPAVGSSMVAKDLPIASFTGQWL